MERNNKNLYLFITDENKKFLSAKQQVDGNYIVTRSSQPYPISHNPSNLLESEIEFATNNRYFSLVRSITNPLMFIKDGAAILRNLYFLGKGIEEKCYLTIIEWNGETNLYELSYNGRFDFSQKREDPKSGTFEVPTVDDSAWGILSQNENVQYAIDCSDTNPKAIRVLMDGITLLNRYTFQTVQAPIIQPINSEKVAGVAIPFVQINEDGDSSGITTKSQTGFSITYPTSGSPNFDLLKTSPSWFMSTAYAITGVDITGSFEFIYNNNSPLSSGAGITLSVRTSKGFTYQIYSNPYLGGTLVDGKIYKIPFTLLLNLQVGESLFLVLEFGSTTVTHVTITPIVSNIVISTKTISQPVLAYGLRPLDLLQQIVAKATDGRYTINSNFFVDNNKDIAIAGDALRGFQNAKIYTSFSEFFATFDPIYYMALRNVNGAMFMEKATNVYSNSGVIIDLGKCIDLSLTPASEYMCNEISVGSPKQDYRHPSGRLEFNSTNTFSLNVVNSKKKMEIVSKYRLGCYDAQFLIMDYQGGSSQDNSGDKSVYLVKITDEIDSAVSDIQTFENIDVDNAILQPVIKLPLENDVISYTRPVISGVAPAGSNVNIYADTVLDGNTTADSEGLWSYQLVNNLDAYLIAVHTGIHIIEATYTDLAAPKSTITIVINTDNNTVTEIVYPNNLDNLYNNKPLIHGVAQQGTVVAVLLDGVLIGSPVADGSCRWKMQSPVITNGAHILSVNAGADTASFNVDTNVAYPLITYIGSELDGFPVVNNLPLIKGVAIPNTTVSVWLNYISYSPLGNALSDANGNWSLQVIPVTYNDPYTGTPIVLAPIINGLNIISTSLVNQTVGIVQTGYKLSRPLYSQITGVIDNTVFNTEYSPQRMLASRYPLLAAILAKQTQEHIYFQTADKNGNLSTTLAGVTISENADIHANSLGSPLVLLEYANIKTKTGKTFAKTLYDFKNGGVIKTNFRGTDIYALPIGGMKIANITSEVQEWKLLLSPLTTYQALLNLYKNGLIINIMKNSLYHSDYNSLHLVTYNFTESLKYSNKSIYDDWFNNRNKAWLTNPDYIQIYQKNDPVITDQIIVNGLSNITLRRYNCIDGLFIDSITYTAPVPAPLPLPDVVLEAQIDFSSYDEGQYFFVMFVGEIPVSISERIEIREEWTNTLLIESGNSLNMTGAIFSTGFKTIIRVEGLIKKLQPSITSITAKEEAGDTEMLYSSVSRKAVMRFGTAYGLPDYLYLKIADAIGNDDLLVEGVGYTLEREDGIQQSDDVDGHPLYYYNVTLLPADNSRGKVFITDPGTPEDNNERRSVILVVDATAFGLPTGSLINIDLKSE